MQERSVTRAGRRLGMSQPALSHALNRLRYLLKDQLFIRTPKGMAPTPRAEQLALPLRKALADMERALEPEAFVPAEEPTVLDRVQQLRGDRPGRAARLGGVRSSAASAARSAAERNPRRPRASRQWRPRHCD